MRLGDPRIVEPEGCSGARRVHGHLGIEVEGSNDGKSPSQRGCAMDGGAGCSPRERDLISMT